MSLIDILLQELDFWNFLCIGWWYSFEFWYVPLPWIVTDQVWVLLCLTYFGQKLWSPWWIDRVSLLHFSSHWIKIFNRNTALFWIVIDQNLLLLRLNYFRVNYPVSRRLCIACNTLRILVWMKWIKNPMKYFW
jgi:hypothetical protein